MSERYLSKQRSGQNQIICFGLKFKSDKVLFVIAGMLHTSLQQVPYMHLHQANCRAQ